ncbi:MAG TPA: hydroxysqualene dehydroxylase HpnE [bacterium]|nr:hydroxysqualene dehydroxylase HpnE [bacterium]
MKKEVLIVGGGFAGLSAGVELANRGHQVTLIERRGHLGGRAYSFKDPVSGATLDNGQHILMGCYKDTLAFLKTIGTLDKLKFQSNLAVDFAAPGIAESTFRTLPLPSPLHLLSGFWLFRRFSFKDKLAVLKLRKAFGSSNGDTAALDRKTITDWLKGLGQTDRLLERFWDPLALAALNDRPELSSAALFHAVLKEALFSGRAGSRIAVPKVGLSELYTEAARDYIERKGGHFLLKSSVQKLHFRGGEFSEAELEGGRRVSAEAILVTVPFTALRKMLPEEFVYRDPFFANLSRLTVSPIVAVNLWYDRPITRRPFVGLWRTKMHWVFNKTDAFGHQPYLSLVVSGAREELHTPAPKLIEMAVAELQSVFPEAREAKLLRATVSKEPEATMAPAVGVENLRLPQKTPYKNFFLAGDWTATGLPATIESAVRSAKKAVELIDRES